MRFPSALFRWLFLGPGMLSLRPPTDAPSRPPSLPPCQPLLLSTFPGRPPITPPGLVLLLALLALTAVSTQMYWPLPETREDSAKYSSVAPQLNSWNSLWAHSRAHKTDCDPGPDPPRAGTGTGLTVSGSKSRLEGTRDSARTPARTWGSRLGGQTRQVPAPSAPGGDAHPERTGMGPEPEAHTPRPQTPQQLPQLCPRAPAGGGTDPPTERPSPRDSPARKTPSPAQQPR